MNTILSTLLAMAKMVGQTILVAVIGILLLTFYTVTGRFTAPMTIPQAKQSIPGISFDQLFQDRDMQFQKVDEKNKSKNNCANWNKINTIMNVFGTPIVGYAAIHREMINEIPISARSSIAPDGMFPKPDKATTEDYIESSWYSFQEFYWWFEVDHISPQECRISHPSQTMKDEIKASNKK